MADRSCAVDVNLATGIIALLAGGVLAGPLGALLALPVAAMIKIILTEFVLRDRIAAVRAADANNVQQGPRAGQRGQRPPPHPTPTALKRSPTD